MPLALTSQTLPEVLELTAYESVPLAVATSADGEVFSIVAGLSRELVEQLRAFALSETDEELAQNTSDRRRFGEGSYEDWFAKGRYPFALVNKEGKLAAIIWYGAEAAPEILGTGSWDTIAFRSYEPYRGKGLMGDFSRFVIGCHARYRPDATLWLETNADNVAGLHLYEKLGFVQAGLHNDRVVMTK